MEPFTTIGAIVIVGAIATALTDVYAAAAKRLLGMSPPDWAMVGRWFGHMPRGRIAHSGIAKSPKIAGERAIGWLAHYAIGIAFAGALILWQGPAYAAHPTLAPALALGAASVVFPLFVMQPAMGAGFAAAKTPAPWSARVRSLANHLVFGLGLYLGARIASAP